MNIKIIDKSDIVNIEMCEVNENKDMHTSNLLKIINKDDVKTSCGREKIGVPSNCALCENVNSDIFTACGHKYIY